MNRKLSNIIDNLLDKSHKPLVLKVIEKLFNTGIPFNLPHKFKFEQMSEEKVLLSLPFKRVNKNHLGGIHACAIATLGEYPAGLCLIKKLGSSKYRLIMKKIEGEYLKQGRGKIFGECQIDSYEFKRVETELLGAQQSEIILSTHIKNQQQEVIAIIKTTWQIKNWKSVTFKS